MLPPQDRENTAPRPETLTGKGQDGLRSLPRVNRSQPENDWDPDNRELTAATWCLQSLEQSQWKKQN